MNLSFDVIDLEPADPPEVGEQAPDFTRPLVNDEYWEDASLSDLTAEGPVVLVFHPMDGNFLATHAWWEIRDREWDDYDVEIVGLSVSSPYEHIRFLRERNVEAFEIFSDPGNDVGDRYGLTHELDGMSGVEEPRPAMFVLEEDRTISYSWVATEWPQYPSYDEIEDAIEAL